MKSTPAVAHTQHARKSPPMLKEETTAKNTHPKTKQKRTKEKEKREKAKLSFC